MSTKSKLNPNVRQTRADRKETLRIIQEAIGSNKAGIIADLAYQALKKLKNDPKRTGEVKQEITRKIEKEIESNLTE